jgi:Domain of unknown function (DUF4399)
MKLIRLATIAAAMLAVASVASATDSPKDAKVYFISPKNGATVSSPIKVQFGLSGMGVAPAGVEHDNTGHHHLIIDAPLPPLDQPIVNDDNHKHFGAGQTETMITLPPGKHTLQLLLADYQHVPHNPPVISQQITITVK